MKSTLKLKALQNVLTVRHASGGQVDLIQTDDVYTVVLKENLDKDPLHTTYSEVQVQCRSKNGDIKFTYCQFRKPECFDFICEYFGIETALDPEKRDGFRAKREQSLREQMERNKIPVAPAVTPEPPSPPGLVHKVKRWFANAPG